MSSFCRGAGYIMAYGFIHGFSAPESGFAAVFVRKCGENARCAQRIPAKCMENRALCAAETALRAQETAPRAWKGFYRKTRTCSESVEKQTNTKSDSCVKNTQRR
jgi:hypothetical protein